MEQTGEVSSLANHKEIARMMLLTDLFYNDAELPTILNVALASKETVQLFVDEVRKQGVPLINVFNACIEVGDMALPLLRSWPKLLELAHVAVNIGTRSLHDAVTRCIKHQTAPATLAFLLKELQYPTLSTPIVNKLSAWLIQLFCNTNVSELLGVSVPPVAMESPPGTSSDNTCAAALSEHMCNTYMQFAEMVLYYLVRHCTHLNFAATVAHIIEHMRGDTMLHFKIDALKYALTVHLRGRELDCFQTRFPQTPSREWMARFNAHDQMCVLPRAIRSKALHQSINVDEYFPGSFAAPFDLTVDSSDYTKYVLQPVQNAMLSFIAQRNCNAIRALFVMFPCAARAACCCLVPESQTVFDQANARCFLKNIWKYSAVESPILHACQTDDAELLALVLGAVSPRVIADTLNTLIVSNQTHGVRLLLSIDLHIMHFTGIDVLHALDEAGKCISLAWRRECMDLIYSTLGRDWVRPIRDIVHKSIVQHACNLQCERRVRRKREMDADDLPSPKICRRGNRASTMSTMDSGGETGSASETCCNDDRENVDDTSCDTDANSVASEFEYNV